jgi:hypothetical protein
MRVLSIVVMALLCSGCFVLDEFEQGEELMRQASSRGGKNLEDEKKKQAWDARWEAEHEAPGEDSGMLDGVTETLGDWWDEATAPPTPEKGPGDELVRCQMESSSRFMSKSDCDIRGGRPV